MVKVILYGTARVKFGIKEIQAEGSNVKEVLTYVADILHVKFKDMKQFLVFVNEVNIQSLDMYKTKLNEGDQIMVLSPSSGG